MSSGTPEEWTDVLVIGGGGAGLGAAIEARALGREVILLEKEPKIGGTTARSVGSISATNTPHQQSKGLKDCPRHHFEDMALFARKWHQHSDNEKLREMLTAGVPDTLRWLMDMGLVFSGPSPEPPHRLPRMHNVLPRSEAYAYYVGRRARSVGVDIRLQTRARRFLLEDARVKGVLCDTPSGEKIFCARGGVVLASGDYTANSELKLKYVSEPISRVNAVNPASTGDGYVMAGELGARILNGDVLPFSMRFPPPPVKKLVNRFPPWRAVGLIMKWALENLPDRVMRPFVLDFLTTVLSPVNSILKQGAVLVNLRGERIGQGNEDPAYALIDQPEQKGFLIFDQPLSKKFSAWPHFISTAPGIAYAYFDDYRRSRRDLYFKGQTVEELAARIGLPVQPFAESVRSTMSNPAGLVPLNTAPFHAFGPVTVLLTLSDGGLAVNENLQILGNDDQPIGGLYGAGSVGQGGLLLEGHGHHIGWAFTSGRIAGRNAAYMVTSPPQV